MNIPSSEYVILLSHDAADFVGRCDTGRWVYRMLKCAALTQAWNVKFAPHAMENVHLHLVAALPNAPFLERLLMFVFKDVPELPGLGASASLRPRATLRPTASAKNPDRHALAVLGASDRASGFGG